MDGTRLDGRRVLVVEDDWFVGGYVADALGRAGAGVAGPVATAADALQALDGETVCAAALDVRVADALDVAGRLAELGVPVLFLCAGSGAPDLSGRPRLDRPFAGWEVVEAVARLVGAA